MDTMQPLAQTAQALADETRLRLLALLLDGEAAVSDLAAESGLAQPRVSSHLAVLRAAGLVTVESAGRQRTYRVDAERVGPILGALRILAGAAVAAPAPNRRAAREVRRNSAIRQARTCYDHLAGVAGIGLLAELLQRGWLVAAGRDRPTNELTPVGAKALRARGVDLDGAHAARRRFAYGCLDWTERRPHLGGALGAAILDALRAEEIVCREPKTRIVTLAEPLDRWLEGTSSPAVDT